MRGPAILAIAALEAAIAALELLERLLALRFLARLQFYLPRGSTVECKLEQMRSGQEL